MALIRNILLGRWKKKQFGFTLIELLIVIIIVALLLSITIIAVNPFE